MQKAGTNSNSVPVTRRLSAELHCVFITLNSAAASIRPLFTLRQGSVAERGCGKLVVMHKCNSPNWLKQIQRVNAALVELTLDKISLLDTREACGWSVKAVDVMPSPREL